MIISSGYHINGKPCFFQIASRDPMFAFVFDESLFAFEYDTPPFAFALLFDR